MELMKYVCQLEKTQVKLEKKSMQHVKSPQTKKNRFNNKNYKKNIEKILIKTLLIKFAFR